jgi:hypothetical protein
MLDICNIGCPFFYLPASKLSSLKAFLPDKIFVFLLFRAFVIKFLLSFPASKPLSFPAYLPFSLPPLTLILDPLAFDL